MKIGNPFKSKRVYTGGVSTSLAIPFDDHSNFVRDTILTSVFGQRDMANTIVEANIHGLGAAVQRYYNYGKDKYRHGLPKGTLRGGTIDDTEIQRVLAELRNAPVTIISSVLVYGDPVVIAADYLDRYYGFNAEDLSIIEPIEPTTLTTFTQLFLDARLSDTEDGIIVSYQFENETRELTFLVPDFDRNQLYLSVNYRVPTEDNRLRVWTYRGNSGLFPMLELDTLYKESEYLPICVLRRDFDNINEGTAEFKEAKEMLGLLGIDPKEIIDALMGDGSEADDSYSGSPREPGNNDSVVIEP